MRQHLKASKGFTLIEILVVLVIIGILAMIAIPKYTNYMLKAKFSEVILATSADKNVVELCVQDGSCLDTAGTAIDTTVTTAPTFPDGANFQATKYVQGLNHSTTGVITATSAGNTPDYGTGGVAAAGAGSMTTQGFDASYNYTLTPVLQNSVNGNSVDWTVGGTCKTRAGGALC